MFIRDKVEKHKTFPFVQKQLSHMRLELEKVITRYRHNISKVNNSNLLVRMIEYFNIDTSLDLLTNISIAKEKKDAFARHFNLLTSLVDCEVRESVVIENVQEIFILSDNSFSFNQINDWEKLRPLKIKNSSLKTFKLAHPTLLKVDEFNDELVIYELDLFELITQFYFWKKLLESNRIPTVNAGYYVYQYLMVSIIPDIFDFSIINSIIDKDKKDTPNKPLQMHVRNIKSDLERTIEDYRDMFLEKNYNLYTILNNIPLLYNKIDDLLIINHFIMAKSNRWINVITNLKIILYFYKNNKFVPVKEKEFSNTVNLLLKRLKNDSMNIPAEVLVEYQSTIKQLEEVL